jgi:hypothetical protein
MSKSSQLLNKAKEIGLCDEHIWNWKDMPDEELIAYYKKNPDWCMSRGFPDIEYTKNNFDQGVLSANGVFFGQEGLKIKADMPVYVLNGCTGTFSVEGWSVVRVYVGIGSKINFSTKESAVLIIDYYDTSKVKVNHQSTGTVRIYRYGKLEPKLSGKFGMIIDKR